MWSMLSRQPPGMIHNVTTCAAPPLYHSSGENPAMLQPAQTHYRAVIVSPHLDDAVFSCGGAIAQLRREGPVLVLNVNTRYLSSVKNRGVVTGDVRYQEEAAAAAFLGFESLRLDELDALFRRPAYTSIANIFRPPVAEDVAWLPTLRDRLDAVLRTIRFDQLLVPLGIGWHADHVLAQAAFTPWIGRSDLVFYEDAPYCWIPHATRYRLTELAQFERAAGDGTLADAGAFRSWREASGAYAQTALMRNLHPAIVRWGAVPVVSIYLYRLMALHRRSWRQGATPALRLRPVVRAIGADLDTKLHAMALYTSQFREFFGSVEACRDTLLGYSAHIAPSEEGVERVWVIG
jgi:LmbE family N-acetylglucosaminyl deacetylase